MWPFAPERSDDEITKRVDEMVKTGEINVAHAQCYERALRAEAAGEAWISRKQPLPRRRGSWWDQHH